MSAPETNSSDIHSSEPNPPQPVDSVSFSPPPSIPTKKTQWLIRAIPFFLSATLFLSGFFAILAPLPLIFYRLNTQRHWALLATLLNAVSVYFLGGLSSFYLFITLILPIAWGLPEALLYLSKKPPTPGRSQNWGALERTFAATAVLFALTVLGALILFSSVEHQNISTYCLHHLQASLDQVLQSLPDEGKKSVLQGLDPQEWKTLILRELPSTFTIATLIFICANLILILSLNTAFIRDRVGLHWSFARKWKTPEWLVWPTIALGTASLFAPPAYTPYFFATLKIVLTFYGIQGLSILCFIFDLWKIRGWIRSVGYVLALTFALPLVLGLGFFDLWFDFRSKFRQS